jgi:hypothetical protein
MTFFFKVKASKITLQKMLEYKNRFHHSELHRSAEVTLLEKFSSGLKLVQEIFAAKLSKLFISGFEFCVDEGSSLSSFIKT